VRGYRCGRRIEVGRHGETRKAKADGETRTPGTRREKERGYREEAWGIKRKVRLGRKGGGQGEGEGGKEEGLGIEVCSETSPSWWGRSRKDSVMLRWRTGGRGEEEEEDARTISSVSVQGWTRGTAAVQSCFGGSWQ
jgi:hypothetical protein